ncbi:uncharacterized protein N7479_005829 [Penicillium vulpinum]|uniref:uncharacterized protein n=1 Tax=Penicillium vulpinum TaxID=29845 RepID=UPI0025474B10|nr:uncharacterized protein N7479_005829 [Penicillium vulpinum]KAJ5958679.1 hypothetical protein N7479_005829 [Penicillium vulpinum]
MPTRNESQLLEAGDHYHYLISQELTTWQKARHLPGRPAEHANTPISASPWERGTLYDLPGARSMASFVGYLRVRQADHGTLQQRASSWERGPLSSFDLPGAGSMAQTTASA